jgi:pimeloyl-ACP methyl ester carboxylesterase
MRYEETDMALPDGRWLHTVMVGESTAPVVVLLHHGLGSVRAGRYQADALARAGYQAIAYDRSGYGGSGPRTAWDFPDFDEDVRDLRGLFEQIGVERAALCGHSDGGTVALLFAARHPDRVAAIATMAAHIYLEPLMAAAVERIRRAYEEDPEFRERLHGIHGPGTDDMVAGWLDSWTRAENLGWDIRAEVSAITAPLLVVQGLEDENALSDHAVALARSVRGARLELPPGARHMFPQEDPDRFNALLLGFLADHLPPAGR